MNPTYMETIIKARQSAGREALPDSGETVCRVENSIEQGYVVVCYRKLKLKEMKIMDGKAVMLLPEHMMEMTEELAAVKYPDPDRPQWILSDPEGATTLTFHLEEGEMEEGDLEQMAKLLKGEMARLYPASSIEEEVPVGEGEGRVCWFSLDIPLIDDRCCHVMFFREMKEGLLMGTFDCSCDQKKQWKPVLGQLFATIREDVKNDEEGNSVPYL